MTNEPPAHKDDPAWRQMKSWLLKSIHDAQKQLEAVGPSEIEHNATRGRIAAWRELITTVEPKLTTEVPAEDEYDT